MDYFNMIFNTPDNFVIQNAIEKCCDVIENHNKILVSVSGGSDSDIMLDMLIRCGAKDKSIFVFFDTGVEYEATKRHIKTLEEKYNIEIHMEKAELSVGAAVSRYGIPFMSKYTSEEIERLQKAGFQWEFEPYEVLMERYKNCASGLKWWCNENEDDFGIFSIHRNKKLKQFLHENPPEFQISALCCKYAKKNTSKIAKKKYGAEEPFDLECQGLRRSEGGVRGGIKSCFLEKKGKNTDVFYPVFWFSKQDKEDYENYFDVTHSDCYTKYKLDRTGCVGCPFNPDVLSELSIIEKYEPKLAKGAYGLFNKSYEYKKQYLDFRGDVDDISG